MLVVVLLYVCRPFYPKKLETFMKGRRKKKEKFGPGITERCQ